MTPHQGDTPTDPRGQSPRGNPYQQPPHQQPPGRFQGQPGGASQPAQGGPAGQGAPRQQGQSGRAQGNPVPPTQAQQYQATQTRGPPAAAVQGQAFGAQRPPQATQPPGAQPATPQGAGQQRQASTRRRLRPIRVEEAVQADVVAAERDTPIATVVSKMAERDVGSVVVVENDRPVGIITDRKVALALEGTPDIAQKQAGELVTGELVTGTTSMSASDALQQLSDEDIRRLPIVNDDGTLEGIVTLDDLLVLLASDLSTAAGIIESQSPRL